MTETVVELRNTKLAEYLRLLRLLASEINRAMVAIGQNAIESLDDSIASQQDLSQRLQQISGEVSFLQKEIGLRVSEVQDGRLREEILSASTSLDRLNHQYAELLRHASRSVGQMVALFSSFQGNFQEGSGYRAEHRTLSCRI